ncbi:MAG TPA: hypothetical protein VGP05_11705 [Pseudonocardia sp.]|jgi:hypothetical protein|uniref:hypothetical protein n=1 Tax=Pseudonocardia sp. Cha107L01 TaxID=3457576 RepID=UPI0028C712ED|nr:hypothetical protein [Pseudonocardia sp.]MDT7584247.1 hypothetical protein [Pseudonocardiales bacterium]MDT7611128.1 hypothetical protein [Pseudonocardiales bacterium]MDT7659202.1 hypothetical protein [Pseudonocardiales bacterium]MDT7661324.1 hypothetical protein [Pseudonocardiales bacterium]
MTSLFATAAGGYRWLAQDKQFGTGGLQSFIQSNIIPLLLLAIAVILLWIGGRGDNAGVARRSVGLVVGLVALGIAVSGKAADVGKFLASLIVG